MIVENNMIKAVIIESKSGRAAVMPKIVIDCTGDGDIFPPGGAKNSEEMKYYIGLVHRLGNTDKNR